MDANVLHALLRDGLDWDGVRAGLDLGADGLLSLARVPAPPPGAELVTEGPFGVAPSGVVADGCGGVVIAATAADRLVIELTACGERYALRLSAPAGLARSGETLFVADPGHARVQVFLLPGLELRRSITAGLSQPTGLAVDRAGRLYVLDRGAGRVFRFGADGSPDAAYAPPVTQPAFLALGSEDALYVSGPDEVLVFDGDGHRTGALALPARVPAVVPGAVVAREDMVFVADAAGGTILVFDAVTGACVGDVPGWRAAVSAMSFDANGDLLVKTDGGEGYARLLAAAGCVGAGSLVAGPFDAGVEGDWERVALDAEIPAPTSVLLETCARALAAPAPADPDWTPSPSPDCLLARDPGPAASAPGLRRFLWLRATLRSADGRSSPTLSQARAQTLGDSYLDQLPRFYARDDRRTRFLERWLALFRSALEAREGALELVASRFDPATAPADQLMWLARALAFEPPPSLTPTQLRALLARVPELYARRGTVAGLEALAELQTGVRPTIIEAYPARRVWQLGVTSLVGFDTALAAATPEGLVVPHDARTDPRYAGLQGHYYKGIDFGELVRSRTDEMIPRELELPDGAGDLQKPFSVRWSGQLKPRFSETYTFHVDHHDGARLWIDGRVLVDEWTRDAARPDPRLVLEAGRWHSIQLEIRSLADKSPAGFTWSSRSQRRESVPRECLYSVLDEYADLTAAPGAAFDVGHAVVGESGPLAASELGSTLSTDYAHLFTVVAPAGSCCGHRARDELRALLDAEKPAHTDYHLCFAEPRMRVGFQARLGIDAIVANGPPPLRLDETVLGRDSFIAAAAPGGARVAARARLGQDTVVG